MVALVRPVVCMFGFCSAQCCFLWGALFMRLNTRSQTKRENQRLFPFLDFHESKGQSLRSTTICIALRNRSEYRHVKRSRWWSAGCDVWLHGTTSVDGFCWLHCTVLQRHYSSTHQQDGGPRRRDFQGTCAVTQSCTESSLWTDKQHYLFEKKPHIQHKEFLECDFLVLRFASTHKAPEY